MRIQNILRELYGNSAIEMQSVLVWKLGNEDACTVVAGEEAIWPSRPERKKKALIPFFWTNKILKMLQI